MKYYKKIVSDNISKCLKDDFPDYSGLEDKVIIQDSSFNKIILFDGIDEFVKFNDSLDMKDKIYNEIIFGNDLQKFKLDIDIKDDLFDEYISVFNNLEFIEYISDTVSDIISDTIKCNKNYQYMLFDSSMLDSKIYSVHIIFKFYLETHLHAKYIYEKLLNKVQDNYEIPLNILSNIIDHSPYKKIQSFRLPFHCKYKCVDFKERYKKIVNKSKINIIDGMIKKYYEDGIDTVKFSIDELSINSYPTMSFLTTDHIIKVIEEKIDKTIIEDFTIRHIENNIISFNRKNSNHSCPICNRIHNNENSLYIIVNNNDFQVRCRRNLENKYISYSLDEENYDSQYNTKIIKKETDLVKIDNYEEYEEDIVKEYMFDNNVKVLIIHSNVMTGKTKQLSNHLLKNDYNTCVFISFRILFTMEINKKFPHFKNYMNIDSNIIDLKNVKKIIIQLDSLYRLYVNINKIDILILDEIESIINQFNSQHIKNIKSIWAIFIYLLNNSNRIICMDANITFRTIELFKNTLSLNNVKYIKNTYPSIQGLKINFINTFEVFCDKLLKVIENNNGNIVIPTNSLKYAKYIKTILENNFISKKLKIFMYSSETDDYLKKTHLNDVHNYWSSYNIIIYTPCITAGISFEKEHFKYLFGYFTNLSCDYYIVYQMLFRVRNIMSNDVYICINVSKNTSNITTKKDLYDDIKYTYKYTTEIPIHYELECKNCEMILKFDEKNILFNVWFNNTYIKHISNMFFKDKLIELFSTNKCIIKHVKNYLVDNKIGNIKKLNDSIKYNENIILSTLEDIDDERYKELCDKVLLTEIEKKIKHKAYLIRLFNIRDTIITYEILTYINDDEFIKKCLNLIYVKNFTIHIDKIITSHITNDMFYMYYDRYYIYKELIYIVKLIGIDIYNENGRIKLEECYKNIDNNEETIKELLNKIKINMRHDSTLFKIIKTLLNEYWDIKLLKFKFSRGGNEYVKIVKSKLFNDTFPVKFIPDNIPNSINEQDSEEET